MTHLLTAILLKIHFPLVGFRLTTEHNTAWHSRKNDMKARPLRALLLTAVALLFHAFDGDAWTISQQSRRAMLAQTAAMLTTTKIIRSPPPAYAVDVSFLEDLKASKAKLEPIPDLLELQEWDKVRSILKVPPVNRLWNLGDVRNAHAAEVKSTEV